MIAYTLRGPVKDAEAFKTLAAELVPKVEAEESGTEAYQWFLSEDGSYAMLYEQYEDSAAFLTHLGNVAPVMDRFMASMDIEAVFAFGDIDDAARDALDGFGATYADMVGGFMR